MAAPSGPPNLLHSSSSGTDDEEMDEDDGGVEPAAEGEIDSSSEDSGAAAAMPAAMPPATSADANSEPQVEPVSEELVGRFIKKGAFKKCGGHITRVFLHSNGGTYAHLVFDDGSVGDYPVAEVWPQILTERSSKRKATTPESSDFEMSPGSGVGQRVRR